LRAIANCARTHLARMGQRQSDVFGGDPADFIALRAGCARSRMAVTIDGSAPGAAHGVDTDAAGDGSVSAQRLYQLVRQAGAVSDHTFAIEFLDPGVQAFAFTFG
jgi:hypothetical protein